MYGKIRLNINGNGGVFMCTDVKKIVEEKRDAERFLKLVAPHYLGVYVLDRKTDLFRDAIGPGYFRKIAQDENGLYSQAMKTYRDQFVLPECYGTIDYVLDYDKIYSILEEQGYLMLTYYKTDGALIKLEIRPYSEVESEKDLSVWIYSLEDVDNQQKELERQTILANALKRATLANKKLNHEKNILDQLCKDFTGVYYVDLNTGLFEILGSTEQTNIQNILMSQDEKYKYFDVCMKLYCERFVIKEERKAFLEWIDLKRLKESLKKEDRAVFHFESVPNARNKKYFEIQVVRIKDDEQEFGVLVGVRYIDDILNIERENQNKIKKSLEEANLKNEIISALAKTFQYVSRVDVLNDYYEEITGESEFHLSTDNRTGKSSVNSKIMCEKRVSKEYQKAFMEFVDMKTLSNRLEDKEMIDFEYRVNDGNWRVMWFIVKKRDENHHVTHVLCAIRSISTEKRKEQKLMILADEAREEARLKTKFLSDMSHDIRTPLNGILGMVEMANRNPLDCKIQQDCRDKVELVTHQLVSMINDILEINKLETEKPNAFKENFDLAELLRSSNEEAQKNAIKKEIDYQIDWDKSTFEHQYLIGNSLYCKRIIEIFADNAIKFSSRKSLITVWCKEEMADEEHSIFEFGCQDHGVGMDQDFLKVAFDAFTQENQVARTKYEGMGLGLAIAKRMADLMSATIEMTSEKGVGTTAVLRVPLKIGKKYDHPIVEQLPDVSVEGLRALVVEDNDLNMEIVKFILDECKVHIECARDGLEAVSMFEQSDEGYYDVILMDIMMPNLNGLDATRKIRTLQRRDAQTTPIIAMSANTFTEDIMSSRIAGIDDYVTKPIDCQKLVDSIKKGLAKYKK